MSIDDNDIQELAREVIRMASMTPEEQRRNAAKYCMGIWDYDTGLRFSSYQEYLDSDAWRNKADRIKEERGGFCQVCRNPHGLNVHHNTYARLGIENDSDLIVLCHDCHELFHTHGKLHK